MIKFKAVRDRTDHPRICDAMRELVPAMFDLDGRVSARGEFPHVRPAWKIKILDQTRSFTRCSGQAIHDISHGFSVQSGTKANDFLRKALLAAR